MASNSRSSRRPPLILPADGAAASAGEAALRMVLEHFQQRRQGQIIKADPIAHCALQAIRGYDLLKLGHTEAVIRVFPRLYELLSRLQQEIADQIARSQPPPESKPPAVPRGA